MDVVMKILLVISLLVASQAWAKWSISSYNIRNFDNDYQAGSTNVTVLGSTVKDLKSDVMGFIEVVNLNAFKTLVNTNLPGYNIQSSKCGGTGKQKLAIVFDPAVFKFISQTEDLTFSGTATSCGSLRPVLMVVLEQISTKKQFVFAAAHLKAGGGRSAMERRWKQYELLADLAAKFENQNLVVLGDLNTTGYNLKDDDYTHFEEFLTQSSMRTVSETLGCTSYWEGTLGTGQHQSSVLDHIVTSEKMASQIQDINLGAHCAKLDCRPATPAELGVSYQTVSDHCPIKVTFK
jgi:endonuclease/exonuclease/phosphatase family metal-dependent hydrolase